MRFGEDITYCVKGCDGCYRSAKEAGEGIHTYADLTNDGECPKNRYIRVYDIPCDEWKDNEVLEYTRADIALAWVVRCYECKHYVRSSKVCELEESPLYVYEEYDYCSHGERDMRNRRVE